MNAKVNFRRLRGSVCAPSSPSYALKAITAAALSEAVTRVGINNVTGGVRIALNAIRSLGAMAWEGKDEIEIYPSRRGLHGCFIDAGESEEVLDIMLPAVSALYGYGEFTGEVASPLIHMLNSHGCRVSADRLPFIIQGGIKPGKYVMPKDVTPYAVSGLLLALPLINGESEIILTDRLQNREYVSETVEVLSKFGIEVSEYENRFVIPENSKYTSPSKIKIDGDFESGACWLALKTMGCNIQITGLRTDFKKEIGQIFKDIGECNTVNAARFPHLSPFFAACAAVCGHKCRIVTGRSDDTAAALSSLGMKIIPNPDGFTVLGTGRLDGGTCTSWGNPYIAMASAICSAVCTNDVVIYGAESADKIYPNFFDDIKTLGGNILFFE